jgi:hypothetical protein
MNYFNATLFLMYERNVGNYNLTFFAWMNYFQPQNQYCESGSGIRCLFYPWIRDPEWLKSQDPDPG